MIKINGKENNLAVDLRNSININWSQFELVQDSYTLKIYDGDIMIYEEESDSRTPFSNILVDKKYQTEERKKISVEISIVSGETRKAISVVFYTANFVLGQAKWITRIDNPIEKETEYYKEKPNIVLKKVFKYDKNNNKEVFIDISGLGFYTVTVNSKRIDSYYLNSDVTNFGKTVYFDSYIVSDYLIDGENTIEIELANGWYNPAPFLLLSKYNMRRQLNIGRPCTIAQVSTLELGGQQIITETDNTWESLTGKFLFNNMYIGEHHASKSINSNDFERLVSLQTVEIAGPGGNLKPSFIPKIVRKIECEPAKVSLLKEGMLIEFDRVISGHLLLELKSDAKQSVDIFYSESLKSSKVLDYSSSVPGLYSGRNGVKESPVIQKDVFYLEKGINSFENKYVYHSFRYVLIKSENIKDITFGNIRAFTVHTDMKDSSSFSSSNEWLNELYLTGKETKLNNIHSYYEDCPRERLGYGGDIVALIESQIASFESKEMLEKVLKDFENDQGIDGGITQTAPYMGIKTHGVSDRAGSLGWQYVIPTLMIKMIKYYGEPSLYKNNLSMMTKHLNYLLSFDYDFIKYCCLGDWGSIDTIIKDSKETPLDKDFCAAVFYYLLLKDYGEVMTFYIEDVSKSIVERVNKKITEVEEKIINEFYNSEGYFGSGSQSSYIFALKAEIGKNQGLLYQNFIKKIESDDGVFRMGIFGMAWSFEVIKGRDNKLIYSWLNRTAFPSFHKMLEGGNKILSEYFTDDSEKYLNVSKNHAMFSSFGSWYIQSLLGIKISDESVSSNYLLVDPYFPRELSDAKGSFDTPSGTISVSWKQTSEGTKYRIEVPKSIKVKIKVDSENIVKINSGFYINYEITY